MPPTCHSNNKNVSAFEPCGLMCPNSVHFDVEGLFLRTALKQVHLSTIDYIATPLAGKA